MIRHDLIPDPGTGDPVCTCGFRAEPSDTIRTVIDAARRVRLHVRVRNRLDARPVVFRVAREPLGYVSPTTGTRMPWLVFGPGESYADWYAADHPAAVDLAHRLARVRRQRIAHART